VELVPEVSMHQDRKKKTVLFICTHNSARSQMAEGLLGHMFGERFDVQSAGTQPAEVQPNAVRVMKEIGIDISGHRAKSLKEFMDKPIDHVVTVCDRAKGTCPFFPGGGDYVHKSFDDPSRFGGSEEDVLGFYRRVRDEIKAWLEEEFGGEA
jgi:arsenate reductase